MKKILLLSLTFLISISSFSQNKFGYIDSQELLLLMPERKTAEEEVQTFAKSLESQLQAMTAEYQQSVQEYQANEATYTDLVKQDKVTEITGLEQRIQSFQQNAQQALQSKEQELLEPILQKARQAIEDVASEGDYTYIFDKSVGSILYVKESENILDKVKIKLKL
ncbi:OmpH family outer membrane protein [Flavobacteriales bacterium]|nr:OmpH family outer membrane protein [Flavobacteriales bacterium]MDC1063119.1 OmpH family outer membrane protein [Flavobacteriales bacterium]